MDAGAREGGGPEALRKRKAPGGQPRLSEEQQRQVLEWLREGAQAHGFHGELWTRKRVAILIEWRLGSRYHPGHVSKLLKNWGWSPQKPEKRASQRDEAAIEEWLEERWPAIKKKAEEEGRTLLFVDESGFYLLPAVVRTYAPVRETPQLRHVLSREHLSVIGAVGLSETLYFQVHEKAISSVEVLGFLQHLLQHIAGKLLIVWDGAMIHRSRAVKQSLKDGAQGRIHLAYAPEVDPEEGIWRHLKRVEMRNLCCADRTGRCVESFVRHASDCARSRISSEAVSDTAVCFRCSRAAQ